jgi:hypothetical protein
VLELCSSQVESKKVEEVKQGDITGFFIQLSLTKPVNSCCFI